MIIQQVPKLWLSGVYFVALLFQCKGQNHILESETGVPALVKEELDTRIQTSRTGSETYNKRKQNVEWIRCLDLHALINGETESQIAIAKTRCAEQIVIQYPGAESVFGKRRKWKNEWDFRPKILKADNIDLTFAQLWDPLFDDLRKLDDKRKRQVGTILATLFYRMAYMLDHLPPDSNSACRTNPIRIRPGLFDNDLPIAQTLGGFWNYRPPPNTLVFITEIQPKWARMSFEAFLHYNSLIAWNEDCKVRAKYEDWTPAKKTGRINTLLTHVRVLGFIMDEVKFVRPSALLGGFASGRGMSPARTEEIRKICYPYIT